jgi:hypothetical protein
MSENERLSNVSNRVSWRYIAAEVFRGLAWSSEKWQKKRLGYRAAIQVERYRPAAVALRSQDPDLYWQILQTANTQQCDPDAYVAVFPECLWRAGADVEPFRDRSVAHAVAGGVSLVYLARLTGTSVERGREGFSPRFSSTYLSPHAVPLKRVAKVLRNLDATFTLFEQREPPPDEGDEGGDD